LRAPDALAYQALTSQPGVGYRALVQAQLEQIVRRFGADTGSIHLMEGAVLVLKAHVGLPPAVIELVRLVPVGKGMAGLAVQRNEPVSACNIQTDKSGDVRPGAKATGVNGAIVVPIRNDRNEPDGALGIGVLRPYEYTPDETIQLLAEAAKLLCHEAKSEASTRAQPDA